MKLMKYLKSKLGWSLVLTYVIGGSALYYYVWNICEGLVCLYWGLPLMPVLIVSSVYKLNIFTFVISGVLFLTILYLVGYFLGRLPLLWKKKDLS